MTLQIQEKLSKMIIHNLKVLVVLRLYEYVCVCVRRVLAVVMETKH